MIKDLKVEEYLSSSGSNTRLPGTRNTALIINLPLRTCVLLFESLLEIRDMPLFFDGSPDIYRAI